MYANETDMMMGWKFDATCDNFKLVVVCMNGIRAHR
jgi:hypothetical protein